MFIGYAIRQKDNNRYVSIDGFKQTVKITDSIEFASMFNDKKEAEHVRDRIEADFYLNEKFWHGGSTDLDVVEFWSDGEGTVNYEIKEMN